VIPLQTFIFIGRSGSGKGTQAELLQQYISAHDERPIFYLEIGGQFRTFLSQGNYTAKLSREVAKSGDLQPPFLAVHIWSHVMIQQMDEGKHLIADGTPRIVEEAKMLDSAMRFYERENPTIIFIDVSRAWSEERLHSRGRADDIALDVIKRRLDWFDRDVVPTLDYLRTNPLYRFITINGEQTVEEVQAEIIAKAFQQ
jgi:adenylate kinase family enzyme